MTLREAMGKQASRPTPLHWRVIDETGKRYGRLVVTSVFKEKSRGRATKWLCICDCGRSTTPTGCSLRSGETRSCGCLQRDISRKAGDRTRTHGRSGTSIYHIWDSMHQRCFNRNRKDFPNYGGRGISVCERWSSFESFAADMGERPPGMTLERSDVDGNYEPMNCVWATPTQQGRNSRANRLLTWKGETRCIAEWAERLGMSQVSLQARLHRGWSDERSLSTPIDRRFSRV